MALSMIGEWDMTRKFVQLGTADWADGGRKGSRNCGAVTRGLAVVGILFFAVLGHQDVRVLQWLWRRDIEAGRWRDMVRVAGRSLESGEAGAEGDVEQWFLRKTKEGVMGGNEGVSKKFPTLYGEQLLQVVSTWT